MATIIEIINSAYGKYMRTCDRVELEGARSDLVNMLTDAACLKLITPENKENALFLKIKIELKLHAIGYFCEGYENDDYVKLRAFAESAVNDCILQGFTKTANLCKEVLSRAEAIDKIMFDAVALKSRVCDFEGRCVAKDAAECKQVAEELNKKIEAVNALKFPENIFTDGASFPDIKRQTARDLKELVTFCDKAAISFSEEVVKAVMRTGVSDITDALNTKRFDYYPSDANVDNLAGAIVLCTPFSDEAEILAWACAGGAKIYKVQALAFEGLTRGEADAVFDEIARRGADCVIYGAPHFRESNKADFYRAAMRFAKGGRRAYVVADDGTRKVYDECLRATGGEFTALDISFLYLSMPDFNETVEEFKRLKMIEGDGADLEFIRKNLAFMGFAGLNEAVKAFGAGADWKKIASERSKNNYPAAEKYMLRLARQALFIDGGWGNYHEDVIERKSKKFDYDDIRTVNPDNIRKIMEGNFTLFQKCGMISTYCLLCGTSAAEWKTLPKEAKGERLTEASKLVMRALGVDIVPVVEVLDELDNPKAGGLCIDGGKRIQYQTKSVEDFDWSARAVCHECFHAFQRMATGGGWQEWYETELHVTPGRIDQWIFNQARYRDIRKGHDVYMIQIVESDARAFEDDCLGKNESTQNILNLVDLD